MGKVTTGRQGKEFYPALLIAAWKTSALSTPVAGSLLVPEPTQGAMHHFPEGPTGSRVWETQAGTGDCTVTSDHRDQVVLVSGIEVMPSLTLRD